MKDEHIAALIEYAAVGSKSKPKEALRWNGLIKAVGFRHVIDMIRVLGGQKAPHKFWERLAKAHPEVLTKCQHYKFPGRRQG